MRMWVPKEVAPTTEGAAKNAHCPEANSNRHGAPANRLFRLRRGRALVFVSGSFFCLAIGLTHPHPASAEELADSVRQVFANNCSNCHGPAAGRSQQYRNRAPKGFDYVLDLEKLAKDSRLIR